MGEPFKNQHIVSQAYLNRFAFKKTNGHYIIGTLLKQKNSNNVKVFSNSVENVGYIKKYYDTSQKKDSKFWEHYLDRNFDSLCGKPLENIISSITLSSDKSSAISMISKAILSRIIISQAIRVPAYLDKQIELSYGLLSSYKENILQQCLDLPADKLEAIKRISFDEDTRKNLILEGMLSEERFSKFCKILESKVWIAYYNNIRNQIPFITSDNPVLFFDINGTLTQMTKIGLVNSRMVILFPLTPSILIGIYSPDIYFEKLKKFDGKRIIVNEAKFINKVNSEIIEQSYIYSFLPEPLFSMAKDIF